MIRFTRMKTLVAYGEFPFKLFAVLLAVRFVNLVWIQSSYVPDEYWQSIEVAHKKVFDYGFLTWEWSKGIRSYFYVSLISLLYTALKLLQLDIPELVIFLPRILQGFISALADVFFIRWIHEKRSGQYSWGLISWLTSYFISYCATRTLINTFEMNLTTIALYYYPWTPKSTSVLFVALVSLLCFIRPTAIILWFPLIVLNILNLRKPLTDLLTKYLPTAVIVVGLNIVLDSYFHGSFVFTPLNFFKLNVVDNLSSFYGTHDVLWYWYAGLPVVLGVQILPFYIRTILRLSNINNFFKSLRYDVEAQMILTVIWTVSVLSLIPHKEFRFLLPLLPLALFVTSGALGQWSISAKNWMLYSVGAVLIIVNTGAVLYLGKFHLVGPAGTMSALRNDITNTTSAKILFTAPCHSFPFYSHLHQRVSARFLTCTPNFNNETNYLDETERFYQNPQTWLRTQFATLQPCTLPTHIVKYDSLNITNFLHINNYTLFESIFNSFYYPPRTGEYVQIYKRKGRVC